MCLLCVYFRVSIFGCWLLIADCCVLGVYCLFRIFVCWLLTVYCVLYIVDCGLIIVDRERLSVDDVIIYCCVFIVDCLFVIVDRWLSIAHLTYCWMWGGREYEDIAPHIVNTNELSHNYIPHTIIINMPIIPVYLAFFICYCWFFSVDYYIWLLYVGCLLLTAYCGVTLVYSLLFSMYRWPLIVVCWVLRVACRFVSIHGCLQIVEC